MNNSGALVEQNTGQVGVSNVIDPVNILPGISNGHLILKFIHISKIFGERCINRSHREGKEYVELINKLAGGKFTRNEQSSSPRSFKDKLMEERCLNLICIKCAVGKF